MILAVAISALIVCTYGQYIETDPSRVCLPDTLQVITFNLNKDEAGIEAVDFTKNMLGRKTATQSIVQDFTARKTYITDASGNCQVFDIPDDGIFTQCLPGRAKWVAEANWGFGPNLLAEDGWEMSYLGGTLKMLITKQPGQPRYVMMSKHVECNGNYTIEMYLNPSETITEPNIFDIPQVCVPDTEV